MSLHCKYVWVSNELFVSCCMYNKIRIMYMYNLYIYIYMYIRMCVCVCVCVYECTVCRCVFMSQLFLSFETFNFYVFL